MIANRSQGSEAGALSDELEPGTNVAPVERKASMAVGAALVVMGLKRRSLGGLLMAAAGGALAYRGVTGQCPMYQRLGITTEDVRNPESPFWCRVVEMIRGKRPSIAPQGPADTCIDIVDQASMESFPASDPPSFSPGHP